MGMRKETDRGRGIWQGVSKANKAKTIFYIECFHIFVCGKDIWWIHMYVALLCYVCDL